MRLEEETFIFFCITHGNSFSIKFGSFFVGNGSVFWLFRKVRSTKKRSLDHFCHHHHQPAVWTHRATQVAIKSQKVLDWIEVLWLNTSHSRSYLRLVKTDLPSWLPEAHFADRKSRIVSWQIPVKMAKLLMSICVWWPQYTPLHRLNHFSTQLKIFQD